MNNYNEEYLTPNLFGEPYDCLLSFFSRLEERGYLLDLGCGQGRNAIALARMGFKVLGIDTSELGVEQMMDAIKNEDIELFGKVDDIYQMSGFSEFDIILLDSMFHFYKKDLEVETGLIKKIAQEMKHGAIIIFCIQDMAKKRKVLKNALTDSTADFEILEESHHIFSFQHPGTNESSKSPYLFYAVQKS